MIKFSRRVFELGHGWRRRGTEVNGLGEEHELRANKAGGVRLEELECGPKVNGPPPGFEAQSGREVCPPGKPTRGKAILDLDEGLNHDEGMGSKLTEVVDLLNPSLGDAENWCQASGPAKPEAVQDDTGKQKISHGVGGDGDRGKGRTGLAQPCWILQSSPVSTPSPGCFVHGSVGYSVDWGSEGGMELP
ncbi:hypothetical protein Salat_1474800 [Sesamum alatum]|uniref:Uncharacterized protein n=1 Tax=Sesamum alatum TaxID=300844 RepID=A0AAE1YB95_9LAMI|nr:hypothetical protein Salat_1474800 [Sesamum alatum]